MADGMREPGVGAAQLFGDVGMPRGEALYVHFVDDGIVQRRERRPVVLPVEDGGGDNAFRHAGSIVGFVDVQVGVLASCLIGKNRRAQSTSPARARA